MSRTLTVGTVNPGSYVQLPVYESILARQSEGPVPEAGEIMYVVDRKQVKLFDGTNWV